MRSKTNRAIGMIFFRVDNYAVVKEILVMKYGTKATERRTTEM